MVCLCFIVVADVLFSVRDWETARPLTAPEHALALQLAADPPLSAPQPSVGYTAHLAGAASGLVLGLLVLRRPRAPRRRRPGLPWCSAGSKGRGAGAAACLCRLCQGLNSRSVLTYLLASGYTGCLLYAVVWNIRN